MLATKNTGICMVLYTGVTNKKRCRTKYICIPFSKLVAATILKAMASGKSPTKSAKTYMDIQSMLETLMNGPNEWLFLEAVSLHKCESSVS